MKEKSQCLLVKKSHIFCLIFVRNLKVEISIKLMTGELVNLSIVLVKRKKMSSPKSIYNHCVHVFFQKPNESNFHKIIEVLRN